MLWWPDMENNEKDNSQEEVVSSPVERPSRFEGPLVSPHIEGEDVSYIEDSEHNGRPIVKGFAVKPKTGLSNAWRNALNPAVSLIDSAEYLDQDLLENLKKEARVPGYMGHFEQVTERFFGRDETGQADRANLLDYIKTKSDAKKVEAIDELLVKLNAAMEQDDYEASAILVKAIITLSDKPLSEM